MRSNFEKPHAVPASASLPFIEHRTLADVGAPIELKPAPQRHRFAGLRLLPAPPRSAEKGDGESEIERFIRDHGITRCPTAYVATTGQASYLGPKDLDATIVWDSKTKKFHRETAGG
jgi:hypothetical protein